MVITGSFSDEDYERIERADGSVLWRVKPKPQTVDHSDTRNKSIKARRDGYGWHALLRSYGPIVTVKTLLLRRKWRKSERTLSPEGEDLLLKAFEEAR